jgi:hypothetical protein
MASALERVNLNLPAAARQQLRRLAKAARAPEATYARELLVEALARAEHAQFRQRLEASRTPARRARDLEIVAAIEGLRGQAR